MVLGPHSHICSVDWSLSEPGKLLRNDIEAPLPHRHGSESCCKHTGAFPSRARQRADVSSPQDSAGLSAWVGWQLDRTLAADRALEQLGYGQFWPIAAAFWTALLGTPPDPRRGGPWSISFKLGAQTGLRLGSTNWIRNPEGPEKRRRMVSLVEQHGGDRRYAEALYKLVEAATTPGRPRPVGRAVEFEMSPHRAESAEFFLCKP